MFSIEETTTWTADDVLSRIRLVLPKGWTFDHSVTEGWYRATLSDVEGVQQWGGEQPDQKILFLDALGWLAVRKHEVKHPAWKPREHEVPFYQPTSPRVSPDPDPADTDPDEVAAVYKTTR